MKQSSTDVCVFIAEARVLLVQLSFIKTLVFALVAHAPASSHPVAEVRAWWELLDVQVWRHRHSGEPLLAMLDANGKVGSVRYLHVGGHQATEENHGGRCLHEFFAGPYLMVSPSFQDHADGDEDSEGWTRRSHFDRGYGSTSSEFP